MFKNVILIAVQSFFFFMLTIPTTYQVERGFLLVLVCLVALHRIFTFKSAVHTSILIIFLFCIFTSLVFITLGAFNGAPGALSVSTVFFVWPLIYFIFIASFGNLKIPILLYKTLVFGICTSGLIQLLLIADGFGLVANSISAFLEAQGGMIGINDGKIEYNIPNLATVIYGFPFLFGLLALPQSNYLVTPFIRRLSQFSLILCFICMFFSGRRVLVLIAFFTPIITLILFRLSGLRSRYNFVWLCKIIFFPLVFLIFIVILFDINLFIFLDDFLIAFDFLDTSDRRSSSVRGEQYFSLINAWIERPFFGYGHGASVANIIRDDDSPWAYELSYVALLFQVGVIGFFVYASSVIWLFVRSIQLIRKNHENAEMLLPLLIGLFAFLVANMTNPYLSKFDYLWVIFLPVSILNVLLLNSKSTSNMPSLIR